MSYWSSSLLFEAESSHPSSSSLESKSRTPNVICHLKILSSCSDRIIYDAVGLDRACIAGLLEEDGVGKVEWYGEQEVLIVKLEGLMKNEGARWIFRGLEKAFTPLQWYLNTSHVSPSNVNSSFLPDGVGYYRNRRQNSPYINAHALLSKGFMPHWVMEVEWEHMANTGGLGHDKITTHLMPALGLAQTRILEAWLLVLPQIRNVDHQQPLQVVTLPEPEQQIIQAQPEAPAAGTPYLAVFWHDPGAHPTAFYPLLPNTTFVLPDYSVFSAGRLPGDAAPQVGCGGEQPGGAGGLAPGLGASPLDVNWLLEPLRYIDII